MHGQGSFTYADGSFYQGDFMNGKRHGKGTYTHFDGSIYSGDFKNGKYNGRGTYEYATGERYVGDFKEGRIDGQEIANRLYPAGAHKQEVEARPTNEQGMTRPFRPGTDDAPQRP